jgi:hypothetical protein
MKMFTTSGLSVSIRWRRLASNAAAAKTASARLAAATAFGTVSLSLGAVGITADTAVALENPDYFSCVSEMSALEDIEESAVIAACAAARYPQDLGACVVDVNEFTGLTASSALLVCQRSRRPLEVANCTIDIHASLLESPSTKVLENCGQSILPERYSACVIDITEASEIGVDEALTQCIRAGYRPWQIAPRI